MVEFYYNCSINEASSRSPFEVTYGHQPSIPAERILSLIGADADAIDRLTLIADIRDVLNQLFKVSKESIAARSIKTAPSFQPGDLVYLSIKGLLIRSHKCKHLRDKKIDPYKVLV